MGSTHWGLADHTSVKDGFRAVRMVLAVLCLHCHLRSFGDAAGILTVVVFGLGNRPSWRDFRPLNGLYPSQRQVFGACALHQRDFSLRTVDGQNHYECSRYFFGY